MQLRIIISKLKIFKFSPCILYKVYCHTIVLFGDSSIWSQLSRWGTEEDSMFTENVVSIENNGKKRQPFSY